MEEYRQRMRHPRVSHRELTTRPTSSKLYNQNQFHQE